MKSTTKLFNKILEILKLEKAIFLTMTFKEEILKTTTEQTREKYIKNYLCDNCYKYIANKDYGKNNNREHYHAIINVSPFTLKDFNYDYDKFKESKKLNLKPFINKLGWINCEFIRINKNQTIEDIAKNLTEHAIKDTTNKSKIIYSKDTHRKVYKITF